MRALLYETEESGHRALYRGYYETALRSVGVDVHVHSAPPFKGLFGFNQHLQALAKKFECDLVHLLTMDDHTKQLFLSGRCPLAARTAPVVATYYLYQNLRHRLKGMLIRRLIAHEKVAALIVPSAMQLLSPQAVARYGTTLSALPEPAESDTSEKLSKAESLKAFGLPQEWNNRAVVLVFGVLNKRRGVDEIVRLINSCKAELKDTRFLFAGPLDHASLDAQTIKSLQDLEGYGCAKVLDQWWSTDGAAKLFACADLFCIAPKKRFQGASSTVARAISQGLTIIAPHDSVAGQCAAAKDSAILFQRADANSFAGCLRAGANRPREKRLCHTLQTRQADDCPLSTDLHDFGRRLVSVYERVLSRTTVR